MFPMLKSIMSQSLCCWSLPPGRSCWCWPVSPSSTAQSSWNLKRNNNTAAGAGSLHSIRCVLNTGHCAHCVLGPACFCCDGESSSAQLAGHHTHTPPCPGLFKFTHWQGDGWRNLFMSSTFWFDTYFNPINNINLLAQKILLCRIFGSQLFIMIWILEESRPLPLSTHGTRHETSFSGSDGYHVIISWGTQTNKHLGLATVKSISIPGYKSWHGTNQKIIKMNRNSKRVR